MRTIILGEIPNSLATALMVIWKVLSGWIRLKRFIVFEVRSQKSEIRMKKWEREVGEWESRELGATLNLNS
jgi:hypothetical protein